MVSGKNSEGKGTVNDACDNCDIEESTEKELNQNKIIVFTVSNDEKTLKKLEQDSFEDDAVDGGTSCGYKKCRPAALQRCAKPQVLLLCMCLFAMVQGFMVNGINNVNTSAIERRFHLSSSQVGWISSSYDVSAAIFILPFTYLSLSKRAGSKPRWLAAASFFLMLGSFIMSLPQFITGQYMTDSNSSNFTCSSASLIKHDVEKSNLPYYLAVFIVGMVFNGVGGTILYSIGITYLDDSVHESSTPLYIGIFYGAAGLGPAIGYIVGGQFLEMWTDFHITTPSMRSDDPRWVGAWWLGPLISGSLFTVVTILISLFPKDLPGSLAIRASRTQQSLKSKGSSEAFREDFGSSLSDLPVAILVCVTNPVFMLVTFAGCLDGLVASTIATYLAKFIQNQYHQTSGMAAIYAGLTAVPGIAAGQVIGGFVCRKMKLRVRGYLTVCVIASCLTIPFAGSIKLSCDQDHIQGYNSSASIIQLENKGNEHCGCSNEQYRAVCESGTQYFTPCYACCGNEETINGKTMYTGCACTVSNKTTVDVGVCSTGCNDIYYFIPLFMLAVFFMFFSSTPALSATIRCIPEKQRTFAIGIQWEFMRLLGTIPGPVIAGFIIDSTCILWQTVQGTTGSCWIHDSKTLSTYLLVYTATIKVGASILYIVALIVYIRKQPVDQTELSKDGVQEKIEPDSVTVKEGNNISFRPDKAAVNPAFESDTGTSL